MDQIEKRAEPKPGRYKHYKDGREYQLLFVALLEDTIDRADQDLDVECDGRGLFVSRAGEGTGFCLVTKARAHGPMAFDTRVCVYVPLYSDKPGRRVSVRPVTEWQEQIALHDYQDVGEAPDGRVVAQDFGEVVERFTFLTDDAPKAQVPEAK